MQFVEGRDLQLLHQQKADLPNTFPHQHPEKIYCCQEQRVVLKIVRFMTIMYAALDSYQVDTAEKQRDFPKMPLKKAKFSSLSAVYAPVTWHALRQLHEFSYLRGFLW